MTTPSIITGLDLATGRPLDGFPAAEPYWIHLTRTDEAVKAWTLEHSGIPEIAARALLAEETRPRAERINTGILLNLRGANLNDDNEEDTVVLRVWLEDNRLVTYERRPIYATRDIAQRLIEKGGPRKPGDILARLIVRLVERLEPLIDAIDDDLFELEDRAIDPDKTVERRELALLQRKIISLRRYLAPQREAMLKLLAIEHTPFTPADTTRLREAAHHMARLLEDLVAAHERATVAQTEQSAQLSEAQNKRLYVFTIVTIIFLPLSFLTGVFGMNVGGLPWVASQSGFAIVTGIMLILAIGVIIAMAWRKWV